MRRIRVLRIGKRYVRDERTLTHLCLVARAFGSERIYLEDAEDSVIKSVEEVNTKWGGNFKVYVGERWRDVIKKHSEEFWCIVHLTMYGIPLSQEIEELRKKENILVVVGGPKVPSEMYELADYNISVTSQPHSEIAALAIFMHEIQEGRELTAQFPNSKIRIIPLRKGKMVIGL
jgi:tRNA (cytidine56-2'-O)-methyltransferase